MSPARSKKAPDDDGADADASLKRLGGGRWQTRDERFTIEPQSGTWSVVDARETDDFGLPLVRGPFKSLTDAKAAIVDARSTEAPESPLSGRLAVKPDASDEKGGRTAAGGRSASPAKPKRAAPAGADAKPERGRDRKPKPSAEPEEPEEPGWFRDLSPADRGRARRLIERLTGDDVADAVGIVRRDLVGDVPALAAHAIETQLAALPADASSDDVVELLVEGRDEGLGVRWRLVDGDGRPITIESPGFRRRRACR